MGKWNTPLPDHVQRILSKKHGRRVKYRCPEKIMYFSKRYSKWIVVPKDYLSDGATGAVDVDSRAWWVHDVLCDTGVFQNGGKCSNFQASMILGDVLAEDGFWLRRFRWLVPTWLFGGGKCRDNGMF